MTISIAIPWPSTATVPRGGVAATAALLAKRAESTGEDFLLAIDAEGVPADKADPDLAPRMP